MHQQTSPPRVTTGTDASCYTLRVVGNDEIYNICCMIEKCINVFYIRDSWWWMIKAVNQQGMTMLTACVSKFVILNY